MARHFILLRLNLFGVDMEGLRVCLSAEGTKNVSWPWLSSHRGWGSLTLAFTGKFVYMALHFILLRLNPFGLCVDREGRWFEPLCHSCEFACHQSVLKTFPGPGISTVL